MRDSSLSACTQAVIAAEVGHLDLAYDYLAEAALMDLRRPASTTRATACTSPRWPAPGSRWSAASAACATTTARSASRRGCPDGLTRLAFTLVVRGQRLRVEVTHETATYSVTNGHPLEILHYGEKVHVSADKPQARPLQAVPARPRPSQPRGREPVHRRPSEEPS